MFASLPDRDAWQACTETNLDGRRQLDLRFLGSFLQPLHCHHVLRQIDSLLQASRVPATVSAASRQRGYRRSHGVSVDGRQPRSPQLFSAAARAAKLPPGIRKRREHAPCGALLQCPSLSLHAIRLQAIDIRTHAPQRRWRLARAISKLSSALAMNAVVCSTALTSNIIAIPSGTACSAGDCCRRNLDAYLTCVWLGE